MGKIFVWLGLSVEPELVRTLVCSFSLHPSRLPARPFSCSTTLETQVGLLVRSDLSTLS